MRTSTEWLRWCSRVSDDTAPGLPCLRLVLLVIVIQEVRSPVKYGICSLGVAPCLKRQLHGHRHLQWIRSLLHCRHLE